MSLKVIGFGGMGRFVLQDLAKNNEGAWDLLLIDSDRRGLPQDSVFKSLLIGETEKGMNGNPLKAREAAEAKKDELFEALGGVKQLYLVAGLGGGTGSGAAMIVAYVAKELRIPCKAYISMPFALEGEQRQDIAKLGLEALKRFVDEPMIVRGRVPEDTVMPPTVASLQQALAFRLTFEVLWALP